MGKIPQSTERRRSLLTKKEEGTQDIPNTRRSDSIPSESGVVIVVEVPLEQRFIASVMQGLSLGNEEGVMDLKFNTSKDAKLLLDLYVVLWKSLHPSQGLDTIQSDFNTAKNNHGFKQMNYLSLLFLLGNLFEEMRERKPDWDQVIQVLQTEKILEDVVIVLYQAFSSKQHQANVDEPSQDRRSNTTSGGKVTTKQLQSVVSIFEQIMKENPDWIEGGETSGPNIKTIGSTTRRQLQVVFYCLVYTELHQGLLQMVQAVRANLNPEGVEDELKIIRDQLRILAEKRNTSYAGLQAIPHDGLEIIRGRLRILAEKINTSYTEFRAILDNANKHKTVITKGMPSYEKLQCAWAEYEQNIQSIMLKKNAIESRIDTIEREMMESGRRAGSIYKGAAVVIVGFIIQLVIYKKRYGW